MKNEPLREAMVCALRNICTTGDSASATAQNLEKVFTVSKPWREEAARARAIVHSIINKVVVRWQPREDPVGE